MSSTVNRREIAYRVFAKEFNAAEYSYAESDEERAPSYVISPTGARINRMFVTGVLTETEMVNPEMIRARVVDPTGAFVSFAGQYQPDELAFLEQVELPSMLAITGKARTFEPEDGTRIFTSVRPESINTISPDTRDGWIINTAERTLERIGYMAAGINANLAGEDLQAALIAEGIDQRLASGISLAYEYYGTTPDYLAALRNISIDAVRVIAGEIPEVQSEVPAPGGSVGDATADELASIDLTSTPTPQSAANATDLDSPSDIPTTADDTDVESSESIDPPEVDSSSDPLADTKLDDSSPPTETANPEEELESLEDEFDPDEFEIDEETRETIENTYGTEFSTADSIESSSEEDLDTADAENDSITPISDAGDGADNIPTDESEMEMTEVVVQTIDALDEGDGAHVDELISTIQSEHSVSISTIEDAIDDALMGGHCYEPADDRLKSI